LTSSSEIKLAAAKVTRIDPASTDMQDALNCDTSALHSLRNFSCSSKVGNVVLKSPSKYNFMTSGASDGVFVGLRVGYCEGRSVGMVVEGE
jgi:hypothetical protein